MKKKTLIKVMAKVQRPGWRIVMGKDKIRFWCSCGYVRIFDSSMIEWRYCPICGETIAKE